MCIIGADHDSTHGIQQVLPVNTNGVFPLREHLAVFHERAGKQAGVDFTVSDLEYCFFSFCLDADFSCILDGQQKLHRRLGNDEFYLTVIWRVRPGTAIPITGNHVQIFAVTL